ncbi:nucleotide pyrophosphohydrolase [Thiogranum longum]|nr:nucleotide pyrophosphohydrolase [Thiogranum longum]
MNHLTDSDSLEQLRRQLARFADERDWQKFHSPKNLSMALIAEAAELVEHFQWLSEAQSHSLDEEKHAQVRLELADILIYLIRTADQLEIDLISAANDKIVINEERYPVEKVRGKAGRAEDFR